MAKGLLGKLGNAVQSGLESADKAIDNAGDKIKDALADGETAYISETFDDMDQVADMLNQLAIAETYKSFKVLGTAQSKNDCVDVLLYVVKK